MKNKFKYFLLVHAISLFFFVCESDAQGKYFEGQIIYSITYDAHDKNVPSVKIEELVGSKMILTFKKGNYKKEFYSPQNDLLYTRYLVRKDKRSYSRSADSDTILWVDISKNDSKATFNVLEDSISFNIPCKVIKVETIINGPGFNGVEQSTIGRYFYGKSLAVNPEWYSDYKEANFCDIIKEAKGLLVESMNVGPYWVKYVKTKSIVWRKVKNSEVKFVKKMNEPMKQI